MRKEFIVVKTFPNGNSYAERSFEKEEDALKFAELLSLDVSFGTYNVAKIITSNEGAE